MSARYAGPTLIHATAFGTVCSVKTIEGTDYKRQTPHLGKPRFQMTVYWSDAKLPAIVIRPVFRALRKALHSVAKEKQRPWTI
jgi:hypothetical protein